MIAALGLSGFFLLHRDMLELAREVAVEVRGPDTARALLPPGRGRGSCVSSIVCYLTGLSHVDPIANELFLGRFLNEEITALPDIDLDFPRDVREVLIPRVHERYGRDRSALVAAFPTYRARGAIRELGKALGPAAGRDRARRARLARAGRARDVDAGHRRRRSATGASGRGPLGLAARGCRRGPRPAAPPQPALRRDDRLDAPADRLLPRRAGRDGGPPDGAMWDKDSCADAGFLKIDLLGLGMLSAVERCVEQIAARARRAHRPLADPVRRPRDLRRRSRTPRRPASSRSRAARRWARCCARAPRTSTTSRSRSRSCARARSSAARSTRTSSAGSGCARTRLRRSPTSTRRSRAVCATRSARSSSRTR